MNGHIRHGIGAVRPYLYGNAAVAKFIAEVYKAEELERLETRGGGVMKLSILAELATAVCGTALAAGHHPAIFGVWQSPSGKDKVEVMSCEGGGICGKLLSASPTKTNPQLLDIHNKDPAKRNQPLVGQTVFRGFKGGPQKWTGGRLYNPDDGNHYSGTITLVDASHVRLKGCALKFLCKAQTWTRVERTAHPGAAVPAPPSGH